MIRAGNIRQGQINLEDIAGRRGWMVSNRAREGLKSEARLPVFG